MKDEELFSVVLDKNEKVINTFRPKKSRIVFSALFTSIFFVLLLSPFSISTIIGINDGMIEAMTVVITMFVIFLAVFGFIMLFVMLWEKKTVYAVTNKRVLIRTGFIGVDYKSLDFSMVGAFTVNVNWIDKLINKNTGSLSFGSMASPITTNANSRFNFLYIENPYEIYRQIKELIDEYKSNQDIKK